MNIIKHLDISLDLDNVDINACAIVKDLKAILTGNPYMLEGSIIIAQVEKSHETNLNRLVEVYKDHNIPQLKALPSLFLKRIGMGNYYAITLNRQLNIEETLAVMNRIEVFQNGGSVEKIACKEKELFGKLLENYEIFANNGEGKIEIGPKDKSIRICRYCHKDSSHTKFDKVAHTVSEAFGNKSIITNDECDICNEYFGKNVEPALIEYLDFFRAFYGIQGKKGKIHHIFGSNYEMQKNDDGRIKLNVRMTDDEIKAQPADRPGSTSLNSQNRVAPQDIYRTLVKYALGILQPDKMTEFENTVNWLLHKKEVDQLPLVRTEVSPKYVKQPSVCTMLRKTDDRSLPYGVSEIRIINIRFLIIIPLCDDRDMPFIDNSYWRHFLEVFKMYKVIKWQEHDFSNREKKQLCMKINFEERTDKKD